MKLSRRRNNGGNKESSPRAMRCIIRVLLPIALLLVTAHRLPAPISEIPEATATARPKAKPKPPAKATTPSASAENESRPAAKTAPTPAALFAGTWTGTVHGQAHSFLGGDTTTSSYSIHISPDEGTISWRKRATLPATCRNHKSHATAKEIV
jgi:hypothetical protein